jgi:glycosyltransferase involved in cell wall biosynthesis
MKVAFLFGGMPHYLVVLLNLLQKNVRSLEVVVILPKTKSQTIGAGVLEEDKKALFKIIRTEEYLFLRQKPYFRNLYKILKHEQPQVVVVGWPYILGYFFDLRLRWWLRAKRVKTIFRSIPYQIPLYHEAKQFYAQKGFFDENMNHIKADTFAKKCKYWLITEINKFYFRWVDAHLNYTTLAYEILQSYGVKREKIFISYNSGDTDALFEAKHILLEKQKFQSDGRLRVVHIGRLVKWKKVHLLIEAFAKVQKQFPDSELFIIGSGPEKENLQTQVRNLGIAEKVIFLGAIHDYLAIGRYLLASTVYVLAGAGGLSLNDAMGFGLPVICSVADGTEKDLVLPHETGLYFKEDDTNDLAEKIAYFFANPDIAKEIGKKAEELIRTKINIHTVAANFVACFNAVTQNRYSLRYEP